MDSNVAKLDTSVAPGARQQFTAIQGNGQDTVTIMAYMCGTDLGPNTAWPPRASWRWARAA